MEYNTSQKTPPRHHPSLGKELIMSEKEKNAVKEPVSKSHKALTITGIVLCVILIPILIVNCVLIIKSFVKKDEVPSIFGLTPMIVLTDSMYPDIKSGDMIIVTDIDAADVKEGDVISFFDPAGNGTSVVTHKVIRKNVDPETGALTFTTKGINNNTEDKKPVPAENIVGLYKGARLPGIGKVALFMQTTPGLIVCVLVPLVLLVGYDLLRRKLYDKKKNEDVEALQAELEALRTMHNAQCTVHNEEAAEVTNAEESEKPEEGIKEESEELIEASKTAEETEAHPEEETEIKNDEPSN